MYFSEGPNKPWLLILPVYSFSLESRILNCPKSDYQLLLRTTVVYNKFHSTLYSLVWITTIYLYLIIDSFFLNISPHMPTCRIQFLNVCWNCKKPDLCHIYTFSLVYHGLLITGKGAITLLKHLVIYRKAFLKRALWIMQCLSTLVGIQIGTNPNVRSLFDCLMLVVFSGHTGFLRHS